MLFRSTWFVCALFSDIGAFRACFFRRDVNEMPRPRRLFGKTSREQKECVHDACSAAQKQKALLEEQGFLVLNSLTITYFHTGTRTIIGVESFHGPVRDGKGWYQLAVVIRHDLLLRRFLGETPQPIREEVVEQRWGATRS